MGRSGDFFSSRTEMKTENDRRNPTILTGASSREGLLTIDEDSLRQTAAEAVRSISLLPLREDESWRKVPLDGFDMGSFDLAKSETNIDLEQPSVTDGNLQVFTFADALLQEGNIREQMVHYLKTAAKKAQDPFALQNLAYYKNSLAIFVRGSLDRPLLLRHRRRAGNALIHRVVLFLADNSQLTFIEEYEEPENSGQFLYWNSHSDLLCGQASRLNYLLQRNLSNSCYLFQRCSFEQQRDSQVFSLVAHCGGFVGKSFLNTQLIGEGADYRGTGATVLTGRQFHDMEMFVESSASHTSSNLFYKAVLKDRSHSIFNGNLEIPFGLKKVHSMQSNNNILLDKRARAESMPRLVIKSDDVSCDHGATVGQIDEEVKFYLMTRGLREEEVKKLLIEGFLRELIAQFPLEEKHNTLISLLLKRLAL